MSELPDPVEKIEVNDLVWIYKTCSGCECDILGTYFVVTKIETINNIECGLFKPLFANELVAYGLNRTSIHGKPGIIPLPWLKKIPPLKDLEDTHVKRDYPLTNAV